MWPFKKDKFKNLNEYEIINISGVDESNSYKNINDIKYAIKNCEKNNYFCLVSDHFSHVFYHYTKEPLQRAVPL